MAFRLDLTTYYSPNRTPQSLVPAAFGRPRSLRRVTLHHWGIDGQTIHGISSYLCRAGGNTSAHYSLQDGLVYQLVNPLDAAWHSGSAEGNATSTGIECRPEMTDGDLRTLIEFLRWYEKNISGEPVVLYAHQWWSSTACPGRYLGRIDWLVEQLNAGNAGDVSSAIDADKKPTTPTTPAKKPDDLIGYLMTMTRPEAVQLIAEGTSKSLRFEHGYIRGLLAQVLKEDPGAKASLREQAEAGAVAALSAKVQQYGTWKGKDLGASKSNTTSVAREMGYVASVNEDQGNRLSSLENEVAKIRAEQAKTNELLAQLIAK